MNIEPYAIHGLFGDNEIDGKEEYYLEVSRKRGNVSYHIMNLRKRGDKIVLELIGPWEQELIEHDFDKFSELIRHAGEVVKKQFP